MNIKFQKEDVIVIVLTVVVLTFSTYMFDRVITPLPKSLLTHKITPSEEPILQQVENFTYSYKINWSYVASLEAKGIYDCVNFSQDFQKAAMEQNIYIGLMGIWTENRKAHILCYTITSDSGTIYIEPQYSEIFFSLSSVYAFYFQELGDRVVGCKFDYN